LNDFTVNGQFLLSSRQHELFYRLRRDQSKHSDLLLLTNSMGTRDSSAMTQGRAAWESLPVLSLQIGMGIPIGIIAGIVSTCLPTPHFDLHDDCVGGLQVETETSGTGR
jgi:hypothetical protein